MMAAATSSGLATTGGITFLTGLPRCLVFFVITNLFIIRALQHQQSSLSFSVALLLKIYCREPVLKWDKSHPPLHKYGGYH